MALGVTNSVDNFFSKFELLWLIYGKIGLFVIGATIYHKYRFSILSYISILRTYYGTPSYENVMGFENK